MVEFKPGPPHLRCYTELVPHTAWGWYWLGNACAAIGERVEARSAFERAVGLEEEGSFATDAAQRLSGLSGEGGALRRGMARR